MNFSLLCPLPPSPPCHLQRLPVLLYSAIMSSHRDLRRYRYLDLPAIIVVCVVHVVMGSSSFRSSFIVFGSFVVCAPLSTQRPPSSKPLWLNRILIPSLSLVRRVNALSICIRNIRARARAIQIYREKIKSLQSKIQARTERSKLLVQRGTPDLEPLEPWQ